MVGELRGVAHNRRLLSFTSIDTNASTQTTTFVQTINGTDSLLQPTLVGRTRTTPVLASFNINPNHVGGQNTIAL